MNDKKMEKKLNDLELFHKRNDIFDSMNDHFNKLTKCMYDNFYRVMYPYRSSFYNDFPTIDDYFDSKKDFFNKDFSLMPKFNRYPMDVLDKEKTIEILLDVPGLNKENVQINLCNGNLEITGNKKSDVEKKDENERYYVRERYQSKFYRSFPLPENADENNIKASFKDGVLKVEIGKKYESTNKRQIQIE